MSMQDTVADMLTRIRNAQMARKVLLLCLALSYVSQSLTY